MSDSQAYEEVTVISHGVTVVKRFEEDEFPVPAIAFEFESERDEEVMVSLVDRVPDGVAVEDLGFHPEYGSEYWTIDDDEITFERDFAAGSEYTSVYGIRATGTDDVEQFLTRPEIAEVDPPLEGEAAAETPADDGGDDVIPESDDDVVRDVISGDAEGVPGLDNQERETDEEIETLDLKDPNQEGAEGAETEAVDAAEDGEADDDAADDESEAAAGDAEEPADVSVDLSDGSLVTALASELRENNVSAEDVKLLRQAFEIAGQEGGSVVARLERVQSDVANLRAYTDAIEEFLDENGTAEQVIGSFESDLDEIQSVLDDLDSRVDGNLDRVEDVSSEVAGLEEGVTTVEETVETMESEMTEVSDAVDDVSGEVSSVHNEVDGVSTSIEDLEESVDDVESELDELREEVSDEDVLARIEDVEDEITDLREWQDQIKSTFGG
jgi:methyl-accepting chemotaxis protein